MANVTSIVINNTIYHTGATGIMAFPQYQHVSADSAM